MKSVLSAFIFALFLSGNSAQAADYNTTRDAVPDNKGSKALYLSLGAGPAFFGGAVGAGFSLTGLAPVIADSPLYVGLDLGANFWGAATSVAGSFPGSSSSSIHALPTALYRFNIGETAVIRPYLGASLGPAFFSERIGGADASRVYLQGMIRPGFYTVLSQSFALQVDGNLGWLGGSFLFNPRASLAIAL